MLIESLLLFSWYSKNSLNAPVEHYELGNLIPRHKLLADRVIHYVVYALGVWSGTGEKLPQKFILNV